jgi:2-polyprenyl-3-methyl-5-hydroxy-6-metoxy-1,4-benzoquinol methylase
MNIRSLIPARLRPILRTLAGRKPQPQPSDSSFTAHNIRLDDGTETMPGHGFLMETTSWCQAAIRALKMLYPEGLEGKRIADLGCLEGGFSVVFARLGMEVVGIEVRESNYRNCMIVKQRTNLPNLSFVCDDAWNVGKYGPFDVIFCCGLLYHLDRPIAFIRQMSEACTKALILNTHFATASTNRHHALGDLVEHEGVQGRWYQEYDPKAVADRTALDQLKWASWSNERSFWIQREYLLEAIRAAGFPLVLEQFDAIDGNIAAAMLDGYYSQYERSMFVGVK